MPVIVFTCWSLESSFESEMGTEERKNEALAPWSTMKMFSTLRMCNCLMTDVWNAKLASKIMINNTNIIFCIYSIGRCFYPK